jgi:hypothetical protein
MLTYCRCSKISSTFSYHGLLYVLLYSDHDLNVCNILQRRSRPPLQRERLLIRNDSDVYDNCPGYVLLYAIALLVRH